MMSIPLLLQDCLVKQLQIHKQQIMHYASAAWTHLEGLHMLGQIQTPSVRIDDHR